MSRSDVAGRIAELVGTHRLHLTDPQHGWPALGDLQLDAGSIPVALFVGLIGLSHRGRDAGERRFQNPGQNHPIVIPPGRLPLLLGLWESDSLEAPQNPVLMAADPHRRVGLMTRYSVFSSMEALRLASSRYWAEDESTSGEQITFFHPTLLPTYGEMVKQGVSISSPEMLLLIGAAGIDPEQPEAPPERARRATTSLIRKAQFGREVVEAYGGLCAMCGLNFGLVEGAHIYPASAPGSADHIWNGVALCSNHHAAFDRHLIWVAPDDRRVVLHPRLLERADTSEACRIFLQTTHDSLSNPASPGNQPRPEMFERRYAHYGDHYSWLA